MAALPYMPLYVADYLADTAHLTALENGAYLTLIMNYWQRGESLPADGARLARIARLTDVEWDSVKDALSEFFEERDGRWFHGRIEAELAKVQEKSQKAAKAGQASAQRRSNGRSTDVQRTLNHTDTDTDIKNKPKGLQKTPRQELETVLTPEQAGDVIEHRRRLGKPLTAKAASLLAGKFARCRDPGEAANEMIANGWQGIEPQWLENRHAANRQNLTNSERKSESILRARQSIADVARAEMSGTCDPELVDPG